MKNQKIKDLKKIEKYLVNDVVKFPTVNNRFRLVGHRPNSFVLGIQKVCGKYRLGRWMKEERTLKLWVMLCDFMKTHYDDFIWNSVIVNKNNKFDIHKDKNNKEGTKSLVIGLGNYSGGELKLYNDDKQILYGVDVKYKPFVYDLKNTYHSVEEFIGDRYSIVFFTC